MLVDLGNPINWQSPLNDGLIAWWIAPAGITGTDSLVDIVDNFVATGAATEYMNRGEPWGRFEAPEFDGANDKYTIGGDTTKLQITGNKTIVAWIKTTTATTFREIFSINESGGSFRGYSLALSGGTAGRIGLYHSDSGAYRTATSGTTNDGRWHQIAATVEPGSGYVLYLDGENVGSGAISACTFASAQSHIGAFPAFRWTAFQMGDIRLYNRPLPQSEIIELYEASHPQNEHQYENELNWLDTELVYSAFVPTAYTVTADYGSATAIGQSAGLIAGFRVAADYGSASAVGQAVGLSYAAALQAGNGTASAQGQSVGLVYAARLAADYGTATAVGQSVNLSAGWKLATDNGTATATGQAVGLLAGWKLQVANGTATAAGQSVILASGVSLLVEHGTAAAQGQAASLSLGSNLVSDYGSATAAGQEAGLKIAYQVQADYGTATAEGQYVGLSVGYVLGVESGTATAVGQAVGFVVARAETPRCAIVSVLPIRKARTTVSPIRKSRTTAEPIREARVTLQC